MNNNGKNTLENRSILIALFLRIWAGEGGVGILAAILSNREFSFAALSKMLFVALAFLGGSGGLGASESPNTIFTTQYSIKAMKTNLKIM